MSGLVLEREPAREAAIARMYAHGKSESRAARKLSQTAHDRAMPGPVRLPPGRCLIQELIEELADGVNYSTWAVLQGELDEDRAGKICAHLAEAFRLADGALSAG